MKTTFRIQRKLKNNDQGISPVIGTILMVAATVIIGAAVYAGVNAYSGNAATPTTDAAFKAQSIDTDSDGLDDTIKITYLVGPSSVGDSQMQISATSGTGLALNNTVSSHATAGAWQPGDFRLYTLGSAGSVFVTVSLADNTVLDQTLSLGE